jgi:nucleotide-binding universal stress UspA family protein
MTVRATILCPIDFSDASRGALRFADVLARHFGAQLLLLAVEDPLLTEAVGLSTGVQWTAEQTRAELAKFSKRALPESGSESTDLAFEVAVGHPAKEILRVARERNSNLILMSTHGLTGMRKLFFGSTTERVLRETAIPVLAIPPTAEGPRTSEDIRRAVGRILVPVDLKGWSVHQVQIARRIAESLRVPLIVTHVVEPVRSPLAESLHLPSIELERRTRAEDALGELLATLPRQIRPEALVTYGDPAEEIAKVARDRNAGLLVIGLHGSPLLGPRMGSVTYRVLCLAPTPVLALPPQPNTQVDGRRALTTVGEC